MNKTEESLQSPEMAQYEKLVVQICSGTLFAQHKTNEYEKTMLRVLKSGLLLDKKGQWRPDPDTILDAIARILDIIYTLERNMEDKYFEQFEKLTQQREKLYVALQQQSERLEIVFDKTKGPDELLNEIAEKFASFDERKPTEWVIYAKSQHEQLENAEKLLEDMRAQSEASKETLLKTETMLEAVREELVVSREETAREAENSATAERSTQKIQEKLDAALKEIDGYIAASCTAEALKIELQRMLNEVEQKNKELLEENTKLEGKTKEQEQSMSALEEQISSLESQCAQKAAEMEEKAQTLADLEENRIKLTHNLEELGATLKEKEIQLNTICEAQRVEREGLNQRVQDLQLQIENLKTQIADINQKYNQEVEANKKQIEEKDSQILEAQNIIERAEKDIKMTSQKVVELTQGLEEKTQDCENINYKLQEALDTSSELEIRLQEAVGNELALKLAQKQQIESLQQIIEDTKTELQETEGALDILKGERAELTQKLNIIELQDKTLQETKEELTSELQTVKTENQNLKLTIDSFSKGQSENQKIQSEQILKLSEEISTLRKQLQIAQSASENEQKLKEQLQNTEVKFQKVTEELTSAKRSLDQQEGQKLREINVIKAQCDINVQKLNGQITQLKMELQRATVASQQMNQQQKSTQITQNADDSLLDFASMQTPVLQSQGIKQMQPIQDDVATLSQEFRKQAERVEEKKRRLSSRGADDLLDLNDTPVMQYESQKTSEQVAQFFAQINELKLQLEQKDKQILELQSQTVQTKLNAELTASPLLSQQPSNSQLLEELKQLKENEAFKDNRIQSLQAQSEQLTFDLFDLQQRFDALQKPAEQNQKISQSDVNKYQKEIVSLQQQLQQAKEALKQKDAIITKTADDREKIEFNEKQLKEARSRLLQISNEKQQLTGQLEETKIELNLAKQQNQNYMKQLEATSVVKPTSPAEGFRSMFGQQRRKGE